MNHEERQRFERRAFTDWFDRRDGVRSAWTAWQARAALGVAYEQNEYRKGFIDGQIDMRAVIEALDMLKHELK